MPHIPRAICVECLSEMKCEENGVQVEMLLKDESPYYKVYADKWKCPYCGKEILIGFAEHPYMEHFELDYEPGADISCYFAD